MLPALFITQFTNWACRKFDRFSVPIYLTSIAALGLLGLIPLAFFTSIGRSFTEALAWAIMGAFTSAVVIPVSGLGDGISLHRNSVLESLRQQVEQADIAQLALQRERNAITSEIASYMHGTVQASLSASIMRLSQALATGNQEEAVTAFNQARAALELPEDFTFELQTTTLAEHLANLSQNWAGLVNIHSEIVGDNLTPLESRIIQTIATEAINNAVRHGNAEEVTLSFNITDALITIDVFNNGVLIPNEKLGMGLKTLDQYARKDWSLRIAADSRVHLSARIKR